MTVPVCHDLAIGNEIVGMHDSGALWWPDQSALIISDLHMEKGSSFARRGVMLPPYDTGETLERLAALVEVFRPRRIIALGDSFHDADGADRLPRSYRAMLSMIQLGREWVWISGNHDPVIPQSVGGDRCDELTMGTLTFRHEPTEGPITGEVCGHLHPVAKVRRLGRSIRRPCFATNGNRLIMPSFGALTGGLNVMDEAWKPVFEGKRFSVFMLGSGRLFPFTASKLIAD
ncbi:ligase-associated DNA damage response endonuclease PdeM [Pseudovibrio sp. SPO723]|uniref:ligase-associated DNA damage response endonuclease PdeM n=1 Tax=Stappiaceae TaxID=2821832 RepID=UPI0039B61E1E